MLAVDGSAGDMRPIPHSLGRCQASSVASRRGPSFGSWNYYLFAAAFITNQSHVHRRSAFDLHHRPVNQSGPA